MTQNTKAPFRGDVVGSFLRPEELKIARSKFEQGNISAEELKKVEDKCIAELIEKEKVNGLRAVTDGEFRRRYWHLDFLAALSGVQEVKAEHWSVDFKGHQPKAATVVIKDKIFFPAHHPFVEHFKYLKSIAGDTLCKLTIPSPSMLHLIACVRAEYYSPIPLYENEDKLFEDLANTYIEAVKVFYAAGCRYLQLDDTSWGEFCDEEKRNAYKARGLDLDKIAEKYVEVINKIVAAKPSDLTLTIHICRGNFRSTWFSSGGYEPVAETLFGKCNIDAFFLEYDSDRAGDFKPLRFIKDQKVVLGLITSKFPELENPEEVKARIEEATSYVPKEQLALSPQCGFSSTEEGNALTEEEQWAKVRLVTTLANEIWGGK